MAITITNAARSAACNAVVDLVDVGAGTEGTLVIYAGGFGGSTLVTIDLATTAFGAASNGVATLAGVPLSGTASGTGTANAFGIFDQDAAEVMRGAVSTSGSDLNLDSTSITSGQTVSITSLTFTIPATPA